MRLLALLHKEAAQHAAPLLSTAVLVVAMWVMAVSFALISEASTLLTAATGMAYYGMPLAMAFVLRRLIVLEYEQHTHEFLSGLPISPLLHTGLKYALGAVYVWSLGMLAIALTVLISIRQELLSARFLLQVGLQTSVLLFAWYGLCFAIAHLGRYRVTAWMLVVAFMLIAEQLNPDAYADWLWTAALGTSLDVTRLAVPWGAVAVSWCWGAVFTLVGVFLAVWQRGAFCAGLVAHGSTRERTGLVVLVVASWLSVDLVEALYVPGGPAYTRLPAAAQGDALVRAPDSPRLQALGATLGDVLDRIGDDMDDRQWPTIVLVPVMQEAERGVDYRSDEHGELVLELDLSREDEALLIGAVDLVLQHRSQSFADLRGQTAWMAEGAAAWWVGVSDERRVILERRAGFAAMDGFPQQALGRGLWTQRRLGPDVSEAVSWVGLTTFEEEHGRQAVVASLSHVLRRRRDGTVWAALWTGLRRPTLPDPSHRGVWHRALGQAAVRQAASINRFRPTWADLDVVATDASDVTISVQGPVSQGVQVHWLDVPPLHRSPIWFDAEGETRDVPGDGLVPTAVDPRRRVAVTLQVDEPLIDGVLWSGMRVFQ